MIKSSVINCPHCGCVWGLDHPYASSLLNKAFEYSKDSSATVTCASCKKKYNITRYIAVSYSTSKKINKKLWTLKY